VAATLNAVFETGLNGNHVHACATSRVDADHDLQA